MEQVFQLTLLLIALVVCARLASVLSGRLGISTITIQMLFGILLGPSVLNLLGAPIVLGTWGSISPSPLHSVLKILAEIGLIQLMFLAGLQTDWNKVKTSLKPILSLGGWGFVFAATGVAIIARCFVDRWAEALAIGAIMTASSFGISLHSFKEMKLLESRGANIVIGAAVFSGLLAILLMIAALATNYAMTFGAFKMTIAVSWFLGKLIMFFAISYFLTSRYLNRIAQTGFQKSPRQTLIGYLLLVASLYAWGTLHFGSFAAVGVASLGGALLGMANFVIKEKIAEGSKSIFASLPVGVLFVVFGMEVNFKEAEGYILFLAVLFVVGIGTKLIGNWVAARKVGESSQERAFIILGALPQGEIGMLVAAYSFSRGLVIPPFFNVAIIMVVVFTMVTPILMKIAGNVSLRGIPQCAAKRSSGQATKKSIEMASHRAQ